MNLTYSTLMFMFFLFTSCSGQAQDKISSWKTFRGNNQGTRHFDTDLVINKPNELIYKSKVSSNAIFFYQKDIVYYIGSDSKTIFALDVKTEIDKLIVTSKDAIYSATIDDKGIIYIGGENSLFAVNSSNGEELWKKENITDPVYSINVDYNIIYTTNSNVTAFDATTGNELWKFNNLTDNIVYYAISVDKEVLYITSTNGKIYAVNAITGQKMWEASGYYRTPFIYQSLIFVKGENSLIALDSNTGQENWKFSKGKSATAATVYNGVVYVEFINDNSGSTSTIYALDALEGSIKWEHNFEKGTATSLVSTNNILLVSVSDFSNQPVLYAFDLKNGKELWNLETESIVNGPIAVNNYLIFVATEYGKALGSSKLYFLK